MHLAVGMANNGDLLCFSSGFFVKEEKFTGFSGHWLSRSTDRGKTWKVDNVLSTKDHTKYNPFWKDHLY